MAQFHIILDVPNLGIRSDKDFKDEVKKIEDALCAAYFDQEATVIEVEI